MKLSINPTSYIIKWMDNKREGQLRLADYLDSIASEATNLATVWQELAEEIIKLNKIDPYKNEKVMEFIKLPDGHEFMNSIPYSRLDSFYKDASDVLSKHDNHKDIDPLIFKVSSLLNERNLTKNLVESQLSGISKESFYDESNHNSSIHTLKGSIQAMHNEAATLEIFAKSFRAKIT
jgi:ACT domain-containing protein